MYLSSKLNLLPMRALCITTVLHRRTSFLCSQLGKPQNPGGSLCFLGSGSEANVADLSIREHGALARLPSKKDEWPVGLRPGL